MAILVASWLFVDELNENSEDGWLDYNKVIGLNYGKIWFFLGKEKVHF